MTSFEQILAAPRDALTVRRVFGDPIERGAVTVIPVAHVAGGAGGGEGSGPQQEGTGSGGGFGMMARPAGVYVIREEKVTWEPALDVTMLGVMGMALVGLLALLTRSVLVRKR